MNTIDDKKAAGGTAHTTAPFHEAVALASQNQEAEFCDSLGAKFRFGLNRSLLYQLEKEGLIRGVSLRRRGALKGKKLWSIDSIRDFLASRMKGAK